MKEKEYLTVSHSEILCSIFSAGKDLKGEDSKREKFECRQCDVCYTINDFGSKVLNNIIESNDLDLSEKDEMFLTKQIIGCIKTMNSQRKVDPTMWNKICCVATGDLQRFDRERNKLFETFKEKRYEIEKTLKDIISCKIEEKNGCLYYSTPKGNIQIPNNREKVEQVIREYKKKLVEEYNKYTAKPFEDEEKKIYLKIAEDLDVFIDKDEIISNIKGILGFSREAIVLYTILFDYYKEHKKDMIDNKIFISFKEIHCTYRGKKLNRNGYIEPQTLKSYIRAFLQLTQKNIRLENCKGYLLKYNETGLSQPLVFGSIKKTDNNRYIGIEYGLGKLGEIFAKRVSGIMPANLIRCEYKAINKLQMGLYISRMIFINQKKDKLKESKKYTLSIKSILDNIMAFGENGYAECKTLYDKLTDKDEDSALKWKLLKTFIKTLKETLQEFTIHEKISNFKLPEVNLKNISNKAIVVEIILN